MSSRTTASTASLNASATALIERRLAEIAAEESELRVAIRALGAESTMRGGPTAGFILAGAVEHDGLELQPETPASGYSRHRYGSGPFARLTMPYLPDAPGVYLWAEDGVIVYVGQTKTLLRKRLGPGGYSRITPYNTYARNGGKGGGQQTNCRINALANRSLAAGRRLEIWYRTTAAADALDSERDWMARHGRPTWNLRVERTKSP